MDKKTKLWLGVGVVGVGAYLLYKSKKAATPVVAAAKFVGADSFASVGARQISATGDKFGSVGARQKSADGFASVGARQISADGGMINSLDVKGGHPGVQNQGVFANQPFTGDVANMVGANGEEVFANLFGSRRRKRSGRTGSVIIGPLEGSYESADGAGRFFDPRTARYGQNEGVFAPSKPKMKSPVEPTMPVKAVKQAAPLNNLVGADGGFFAVHDGFGK